jgi:hypothetical protein
MQAGNPFTGQQWEICAPQTMSSCLGRVKMVISFSHTTLFQRFLALSIFYVGDESTLPPSRQYPTRFANEGR